MVKVREIFHRWRQEKIKAAAPGEVFWFITQGDVNNGMPSWETLPQKQRWMIVNYVQNAGLAAGRRGEALARRACEGGTIERSAAQAAVHRLPL